MPATSAGVKEHVHRAGCWRGCAVNYGSSFPRKEGADEEKKEELKLSLVTVYLQTQLIKLKNLSKRLFLCQIS